MEIYIERSEDTLTSQKLIENLKNSSGWDNSIVLEIRQKEHFPLKTADPTVLAAIFTMGGTALGALISGVLQVAQANYKEKIVLVTKEGLRIEVEARHAHKKIPELIKLLRSMDVEIIRI